MRRRSLSFIFFSLQLQTKPKGCVVLLHLISYQVAASIDSSDNHPEITASLNLTVLKGLLSDQVCRSAQWDYVKLNTVLFHQGNLFEQDILETELMCWYNEALQLLM